MLINCSHCQSSLDVSPEHYGQTIQCPVCNGRLRIEPPDDSAGSGQNKPKRKGWEEGDHANVDALKAFLIGLGTTVVFLGLMFPLRGNIGAISSTAGGSTGPRRCSFSGAAPFWSSSTSKTSTS